MAISFEQIPNSILVPGQYIEIGSDSGRRNIYEMPTRALIFAQKLSSGAAAANVPFTFGQADQVAAQCGRGSMAHRMAMAFRTQNPVIEAWMMPLADAGAGVAATGTVGFAGTITGPGTVNLYIGGRRVRVAVATTDTPTTVAAAMATAVNADTLMAATATSASGTLTITARHKGEVGNGIDVRLNRYAGEFLPAGLTATVTAMANGTGNPDCAAAIAALGDIWFTDVVFPYTDGANLALIGAEAEERNGPLVMQDMPVYAAVRSTYAGLTTFAGTVNDKNLFVGGLNKPACNIEELAAAYGGACSYFSPIDPARPLQTLPLTGIGAPAPEDRLTKFPERNVLLGAGIGTFMIDDGGIVRIERAVSTYTTDPYGVPDVSWRDLEVRKTIAWLRYQRRARVATKFPRHKLAPDGTRAGAGQALVTPKIIRADGIAQFRAWEEQGMVQSVDSWASGYIVEIDAEDHNRVNELIPVAPVNQLRVFASRIAFSV